MAFCTTKQQSSSSQNRSSVSRVGLDNMRRRSSLWPMPHNCNNAFCGHAVKVFATLSRMATVKKACADLERIYAIFLGRICSIHFRTPAAMVVSEPGLARLQVLVAADFALLQQAFNCILNCLDFSNT